MTKFIGGYRPGLGLHNDARDRDGREVGPPEAMRDTNVDWIHDLPFHSFDAGAYGRSVAHVAFTYSTPWLALTAVTVVAWALFTGGACAVGGRFRGGPRRWG